MPQVFLPGANAIAKLVIFGGLVLIVGLFWLIGALWRSTYATDVGVPREQPVPFSHQHHVSGLGIDCRYCHDAVEISSSAGIPPTYTCMTCHSQIWTNAEMLAPVRQSLEYDRPLQWTRVNDLPDFVYFNHSIHVSKGVGCVTCHGRVDQMPLTWKAHSLYMEWCLDCHRAPERYIRPREHVLDMDWQPPPDRDGGQLALGRRLVKEYGINKKLLTNCWTCHR